eukprot:10473039-Lingulodinium_polyedra.AAC.1
MDCINARQLASCVGTLAQRLQALQAAKAKGGTLGKAARIELTHPGGVLSSGSGLHRLTQ